MITAKVLADTYNTASRSRLTTLELYYPRFIHSEFMTHRMFSRNASSSRAIPVKKILGDVVNLPAMPSFWGKNQKGMQSGDENTTLIKHPRTGELLTADQAWLAARDDAVEWAKAFDEAGYAKQDVNRITEPYAHIRVVVTATEWSNFFLQRCHPDAQPDMRLLAEAMRSIIEASEPVVAAPKMETMPYIHLPYITEDDKANIHAYALGEAEGAEQSGEYHCFEHFYSTLLMRVCTARCARTSYRLHDGGYPSIEADLTLADDLEVKEHWSPFEHAALLAGYDEFHANLRGFSHYRTLIGRVNQAKRDVSQTRAQKIASLAGGEVTELSDGRFMVSIPDADEDGRNTWYG